jgi:uncharacterized membrane protein YphA (DoxX/SURF4 family)
VYPLAEQRYTLPVVQRLFAMFPGGGPGVALLLLRISVAILPLLDSPVLDGPVTQGILASRWAMGFLSIAAISLCFGFLTPIFSILVCVLDVLGVLLAGRFDSPVMFFLILNPVALALLGPGAYSLDARIFGRRVLVVSSGKDPSDR